MTRFTNKKLDDIPKLALKIAKTLKGGETLALIGPLGAGKTTFTQLLAKALGVKTHVTSPTFIIMNRYRAKLPKLQTPIHLYHLDLYRTKDIHEVNALGLMHIWGQPNTITVIEWADKIKAHLPKHSIVITFTHS